MPAFSLHNLFIGQVLEGVLVIFLEDRVDILDVSADQQSFIQDRLSFRSELFVFTQLFGQTLFFHELLHKVLAARPFLLLSKTSYLQKCFEFRQTRINLISRQVEFFAVPLDQLNLRIPSLQQLALLC